MFKLLAVAATLSMAGAVSANAAVTIGLGTQPTTQVHGAGGAQGPATDVFGVVSGQSFTFHSTDLLSTNGGGHAFVQGVFDNLDLFLTSDPLGFTIMNFDLEMMAASKQHPVAVDITAFLIGGGSQTYHGSLDGNFTKFFVESTGGDVLDKVSIATALNMDSVRQVDVNVVGGGVPEPAEWALMLMGFGLIGATLRTSRRQGVAA
jgi:hypothetical protein